MKLKVDREADALYLSLSEAPATESEEGAPGIIVDYNEQGQAFDVRGKEMNGHRVDCTIFRRGGGLRSSESRFDQR